MLSCLTWAAPALNEVRHSSHQTIMIKLTIPNLVEQGKIAARLYDECDNALSELNDSFGTPYEAARTNLTTELMRADCSGIDLSVFQGKESLFKYPEFNANIVVRITAVPTGHTKLEKIDEKIAQLELKLKQAKLERKHLVEQLKITSAVDFVTEKIVTAFSRIK